MEVPDGVGAARLDLGEVGGGDGQRGRRVVVGHALAAPYEVTLPAEALWPGRRTLEVLVSNSAANYDEGDRRPSGLLGPITLAL